MHMSIPVDVADLARALGDFDAGYLLTVSSDGRVKVIGIVPEVDDSGSLVVSAPGRGSLANLALNKAVTMIFAPREPSGHTLLVDGTATVTGGVVRVKASGAVLHRAADH
jgi:hypothetical protein